MTKPSMYLASVTCTAFQEVTWQAGSIGPFTDELAVFRVLLSQAEAWQPQLRKCLSPDELERALRYRRPDDLLRFSCTRGLLRMLLAHYTHQLPNRIEFVAGINRKPELKHSGGWYFNVSHSGDWILIAIGKVQVGVDLEGVNANFPFRDVLPLGFSPAELTYINTCRDARLCFYRLWTCKEALVKATAKGMDDEFDQIPSLPGTHPADSRLMGQHGHWTVHSFAVTDTYPAAVAYGGDVPLSPQFYTLDLSQLVAII